MVESPGIYGLRLRFMVQGFGFINKSNYGLDFHSYIFATEVLKQICNGLIVYMKGLFFHDIT